MGVSRRSFVAGTLGSFLALIFGMFGRQKSLGLNHLQATEMLLKLEEAKRMLDENNVPGSRTLLLSEQQHEDLLKGAAYRMQPDAKVNIWKSEPILPSYEVIKWQRLT